ncbi:MBL fold metallo-hydrolase, partial [Mesorhizobium sp. M8A.F.Ca.ET.213.01.1.1]
TSQGCLPVDANEPRRLKPEKVARLDWHNDLSKLLLAVTEAVNTAADERGRAAIIRRMRRALDAPALGAFANDES